MIVTGVGRELKGKREKARAIIEGTLMKRSAGSRHFIPITAVSSMKSLLDETRSYSLRSNIRDFDALNGICGFTPDHGCLVSVEPCFRNDVERATGDGNIR
jgi:hypothetical protein